MVSDLEEVIDNVIRPFVVERPYDPSGDYYMSSVTTARCIEIKPGLKIYYKNEDACSKMSEELTNRDIKNQIGYNSEADWWSVAIL